MDLRPPPPPPLDLDLRSPPPNLSPHPLDLDLNPLSSSLPPPPLQLRDTTVATVPTVSRIRSPVLQLFFYVALVFFECCRLLEMLQYIFLNVAA